MDHRSNLNSYIIFQDKMRILLKECNLSYKEENEIIKNDVGFYL